jgi:hypothetical protein
VITLGTDLATLDREALARFRALDVAFCPQAPRLVPFLSALENVELALAIRRAGDTAASRTQRAREALDEVGLADLASEPPETPLGRRAGPRRDRPCRGGPTTPAGPRRADGRPRSRKRHPRSSRCWRGWTAPR